jgi:PTS system cellobiose-specific IIB component
MTIHIALVCAAGMSTSLLVSKMKEVANKEGLDVSIVAMSESAFSKYEGHTDFLLLSPQVSYMYDKMKSLYEPKGIVVSRLNMMDYGMMNGQKILHDTLTLNKKGEE